MILQWIIQNDLHENNKRYQVCCILHIYLLHCNSLEDYFLNSYIYYTEIYINEKNVLQSQRPNQK